MKRFFYFLLLAVLIFGCGHRKSPTGGKKDEIKPEIIAISPLEFSDLTARNIEVVFSKPIERNSIFSGIYIYPPIQNKKFKWDKSILTIKILEKLEENTNYYVTFNTRIKGEHGNELDREYTYIFASGSLAENRISGRVVYEDEEDSSLPVLCTLLTADSTFIYQQSITTSTFSLENLNHAEHIIEAYCDKNKNRKYDYGKEPYCFQQVTADKFQSINLEMAYSDTLKPSLKSASAIWNNQIEIIFDEAVSDLKQITIESTDSLSKPLRVITKALKEDRILIITEPMDTLKYEAEISGLTDLKKNMADTLSIILNSNALKDSIAPKVISFSPRSGGTVHEYKPIIKIGFSEIIFKTDLIVKLIEAETEKEIMLEVTTDHSDMFELIPTQQLTNYATYHISVEAMDVNGNIMPEKSVGSFIVVIRQ